MLLSIQQILNNSFFRDYDSVEKLEIASFELIIFTDIFHAAEESFQRHLSNIPAPLILPNMIGLRLFAPRIVQITTKLEDVILIL